MKILTLLALTVVLTACGKDVNLDGGYILIPANPAYRHGTAYDFDGRGNFTFRTVTLEPGLLKYYDGVENLYIRADSLGSGKYELKDGRLFIQSPSLIADIKQIRDENLLLSSEGLKPARVYELTREGAPVGWLIQFPRSTWFWNVKIPTAEIQAWNTTIRQRFLSQQ